MKSSEKLNRLFISRKIIDKAVLIQEITYKSLEQKILLFYLYYVLHQLKISKIKEYLTTKKGIYANI